MTNPIIHGYLEDPYLRDGYLLTNVTDHFGIQSKFVINAQKAIAAQARAVINASNAFGAQTRAYIANLPNAIGEQAILTLLKESDIGAQLKLAIESQGFSASQVEQIIIKDHSIGIQANFFTSNFDANGIQTLMVYPDKVKFIGVQSTATVLNSKANGIQSHFHISERPNSSGVQSLASIVDHPFANAGQSQLVIHGFDSFGVQSLFHLNDKMKEMASQFSAHVVDHTKSSGLEVRIDKSFPHIKCEDRGYLKEPYLEGQYLAAGYCVDGPIQVEIILIKPSSEGIQAKAAILAWTHVAAQIMAAIVNHMHPIALQFSSYQAKKLGVQFTAVLYNTNRLRVLYTFPSRGVTGTNWTATSTAAGDFSVNNLNTDIVEQRWQSAATVTTATLTCDTEVVQGVPIDTLAILSHNLTTSANLTLEGSADNFATVGESMPLTIARGEEIYYIAEEYPKNYWRYWRIQIVDSTNPDAYLRIGTIVFGSSTILQGENFTDIVQKKKIHFSDKVKTEGFTSMSNDRALKKSVNLDFQKISYERGNYKNLEYIFDYARTSLKCLWIPDPQSPDRFSVFGKLAQMPDESHQNMGEGADFVDFTVEVDESL